MELSETTQEPPAEEVLSCQKLLTVLRLGPVLGVGASVQKNTVQAQKCVMASVAGAG